ncbi:nitroreductase/quinone reductase family protein [Solwaraspora sp. WMMD792]|uniref:nitroreductase/quinone reductase family protein n=2 Tax=unclassified Solwaraspora TaxID=2627926 RepID=UPI002417CCA2|nr:nitroreductase/quinone reductase family protein [Solwaraspora sp. WMMD792]MDG4772681.1 nitroreductase/quinone reductase family protein [Solwaraspora sp. WMMD792]
MPLMPRDEAIDFNRRVIEEFRANAGRVGGILADSLVILVHHVGVRTGIARITPLICFPFDDQRRYAVIGSNGDSPVRPAWCANLAAMASTTVELGEETFRVTVEPLGDEARSRLWSELFGETTGPDEFAARTGRRLPMFLLTRTD